MCRLEVVDLLLQFGAKPGLVDSNQQVQFAHVQVIASHDPNSQHLILLCTIQL